MILIEAGSEPTKDKFAHSFSQMDVDLEDTMWARMGAEPVFGLGESPQDEEELGGNLDEDGSEEFDVDEIDLTDIDLADLEDEDSGSLNATEGSIEESETDNEDVEADAEEFFNEGDYDFDNIQLVDSREVEFAEEDVSKATLQEVKGITDSITQMDVVDLKEPRLVIDGRSSIPVSLKILIESASVDDLQKLPNTEYYTFYVRAEYDKYLDIGDYPQKFVSLVGNEVPKEDLTIVGIDGEEITGSEIDVEAYEPIFAS